MNRGFNPTQVQFAPTYQCNLHCAHCCVPQSKVRLPVSQGLKFLKQCRQLGIRELGFTGGEPFLYLEFLSAVSENAVKLGYTFDRIMTNAGWFKGQRDLETALRQIINAGFNGTFCISVDDFHKVPVAKIARFMVTAVKLTGRVAGVSLVYVNSLYKLRELARVLSGKVNRRQRLVVPPSFNFPGLSAKITRINLCPIGQAGTLAVPWGTQWFREDYCQGPGQVLYVDPNGNVKPCCGFASDLPEMTIGNIYRQRAKEIIKEARSDRFIRTVYNQGLLALRDIYVRCHPAEKLRPTKDHCFFCWYLQKKGIRSCLGKK
ncbi:MAG: radical SAM protein [bacterium]|nr:radical SAM protein [bacterium]MDD5354777.1 radical SAM protein [bacterium]MDD5756910.1 radical SAM protein [bacterium]